MTFLPPIQINLLSKSLLSWARLHVADVLSAAGSRLSLAVKNLAGLSVVVLAGSHLVASQCLLILVLLARSRLFVTQYFLVAVLLYGVPLN